MVDVSDERVTDEAQGPPGTCSMPVQPRQTGRSERADMVDVLNRVNAPDRAAAKARRQAAASGRAHLATMPVASAASSSPELPAAAANTWFPREATPPGPRKPDLHLKCMSKRTGQRSGRVGVGWIDRDENGGIVSITVSVDFPNKMEADDDMTWKLFPAEFVPHPKTRSAK